MEVVLLTNIKKLGKPGEIKTVTRGYAVNFLIPSGFALPALPGFIKEATARTRKMVKTMTVDTSELAGLFEKIDGLKFEVTRKASREGKLYGSVKVSDVIDLIESKVGRSLDEKYVVLKEPIKALGETDVVIMASELLQATISINVLGDEVKADKSAKKAKLKAKATAKDKAKKK